MKQHTTLSVTLVESDTPSQLIPILNEIQFKLHRLLLEGQCDSIDLRSLPMFPGDYDLLKQHLGQGELRIHLDAMGPSEIYETAISGVWWVTHSNLQQETVADFIEITRLPAILETAPQEVENGLTLLKDKLNKLTLPATYD